MNRSLFLIGVSLVALPAARASDLAVNPLRPGAFPTLQAALDAAQPGDRILVETSLPATDLTVIRKSVTIESADGQRKLLPYLGTPVSPGQVLIEAITPGLPLVFRKLDFRFERLAGGDRGQVGIRTLNEVRGVVHFDGMSVETEPLRPQHSVQLMDVRVTELWIRDSRIIARDARPADGCASIADNRCSEALAATCRILVIEDSELFGGSANFLRYSGCTQDNQAPMGGPGGAALRASTDATILVRSFFSDGNGGDVQEGPWLVTPVPGRVTPSEFIQPGGFFEAYDSVIEHGRDGSMLKIENLARQPAVQLSLPFSPLKLDGDVRPGGVLNLNLVPYAADSALVLIGLRWSFARVAPIGFFWIHPSSLVANVLISGHDGVTLPLPMDMGLVGLPLIGQAVLLNRMEFTNPSFVQFRR